MKLLTATWWKQIFLRFAHLRSHTHLVIVSGVPQKPTKSDRVGDAAEVDE